MKFKLGIKMEKKGNLCDFERDVVVGGRWTDVSISGSADLLVYNCTCTPLLID